jgi:hypothetical protein
MGTDSLTIGTDETKQSDTNRARCRSLSTIYCSAKTGSSPYQIQSRHVGLLKQHLPACLCYDNPEGLHQHTFQSPRFHAAQSPFSVKCAPAPTTHPLAGGYRRAAMHRPKQRLGQNQQLGVVIASSRSWREGELESDTRAHTKCTQAR